MAKILRKKSFFFSDLKTQLIQSTKKKWVLLLAQYSVFNENRIMSKLKSFFKKFNKKSQTQDELDDEVEYETYETQVEDFPDQEAEELEKTLITDTDQSDGELESFDLGEETIILDGIEVGEELIPHESQQEAQIPPDQELKFPTMPDKAKNIPVQEKLVSEKNDQFSLPDYDETDSQTLDLTQTNFSVRDKVEQLKLRVLDRFRNLNTKDLNEAYKQNGDFDPKLNFEDIKKTALKVNLINIPEYLFSRSFRPIVHRWYQKSFVSIALLSLATLIGMLIEGTPNYNNLTKKNYLNFDDSKKLSLNHLKQIQSANIFKTTQIAAATPKNKIKINNNNKVCKQSQKKSRSGVKLLNSIVLQDSVKSIASIHIKSGKNGQQNIREGAILPGNYKVDKIEKLKLIVKNLSTGECEFIENSAHKKELSRIQKPKVLSPRQSVEFKKRNKKIKGIDTDGKNFNIKKSFLESKLQDINSLLTQARGIPVTNPDNTLSFKIVEIQPGSIFDYLGIQDGDMISHINGTPINNMNDVMNLFGRISKVSSLNLTINRGGENVTQKYNIK